MEPQFIVQIFTFAEVSIIKNLHYLFSHYWHYSLENYCTLASFKLNTIILAEDELPQITYEVSTGNQLGSEVTTTN